MSPADLRPTNFKGTDMNLELILSGKPGHDPVDVLTAASQETRSQRHWVSH
jgi:hypothetical protein